MTPLGYTPPITPEQDRAYCESKGRVLGEDPPTCPRWDDALCGSDGPCPSCRCWEDEVSLGVPERPSDDPWQGRVLEDGAA